MIENNLVLMQMQTKFGNHQSLLDPCKRCKPDPIFMLYFTCFHEGVVANDS